MEYHEYANLFPMMNEYPIEAIAISQNTIIIIRQSTIKDFCFIGFVENGVYEGFRRPVKKDFLEKIIKSKNIFPNSWIVKQCEPIEFDPYLMDYSKEKKESFVYCIQAVMGGPIKIGISQYPDGRIELLQTGSPFKLQVISVHKGGSKLERKLHKHFAYCNTYGEWFDTSHEEILNIIQENK